MDRASAGSGLNIEDPAQLVNWLRHSGRIPETEQVHTETLSGGVSNRVVRVFRENGRDWVLKQALPKLRVQADWMCSVERIHREAHAMRWLPRLTPPGSVPELVFEDVQHHLLAMEAVPAGFRNWKDELMSGEIEPEIFVKAGILLASIHGRSSRNPQELGAEFADASFFEVLRIEPFYRHVAQALPQLAGFLGNLIEETRASRTALVHGDFSPKNLLVTGCQLVLVDHEVAHWGDPMFDLGFLLAHFLSKIHALPERRAPLILGIGKFWSSYRHHLAEESGAGRLMQESRAVRHALGCLVARAVGKSPLPYLDPTQRERQVRIGVALSQAKLASWAELVDAMVRGLQKE